MPTPVPVRIHLNFELQDDRGFRARARVTAFLADVTAAAITTATLWADTAAVGTAVQAMSNAKVVSTGFSITGDIAQEPSTETGTYQLVNQGAHLLGGDGNTLQMSVTVPAPVDALFLTTTQDDLIVVNPASSLLTAFQAACAPFVTPTGGHPFSQFFGGQLRSQKPRRRRVLQGA